MTHEREGRKFCPLRKTEEGIYFGEKADDKPMHMGVVFFLRIE
jgi:hypothetical protein